MSTKRTVFNLIVFGCVCFGAFFLFQAQYPNTLEFLGVSNHTKNKVIEPNGKEINMVEDIFLNKIEYTEENLFQEFPQQNDEFHIMLFPREIVIAEYEELILNFGMQKNPDKPEFIVFGNISGGQDRHGYIRGQAYYDLLAIIDRYHGYDA